MKSTRSGSDDVARHRRREIRNAAVRTFATKGFHATRVSDIAKEAGVAYGLVYHYFDSKEQLLEQIFERTWSHLVTGLKSIRDSDRTAREQIGSIVRLMLGSYTMSPELVQVLILEVTRSDQLRRQVGEIQQGFTVIEDVIRQGQESGELRSDISPLLASYILWGAIDEVVTGWVFDTIAHDDDAVADAEHAIVSVMMGGMSPSAESE